MYFLGYRCTILAKSLLSLQEHKFVTFPCQRRTCERRTEDSSHQSVWARRDVRDPWIDAEMTLQHRCSNLFDGRKTEIFKNMSHFWSESSVNRSLLLVAGLFQPTASEGQKISYWWRGTTEIGAVSLIGCYAHVNFAPGQQPIRHTLRIYGELRHQYKILEVES